MTIGKLYPGSHRKERKIKTEKEVILDVGARFIEPVHSGRINPTPTKEVDSAFAGRFREMKNNYLEMCHSEAQAEESRLSG